MCGGFKGTHTQNHQFVGFRKKMTHPFLPHVESTPFIALEHENSASLSCTSLYQLEKMGGGCFPRQA